MPGWHERTRRWQRDGDIRMVGIIQEQHPDRARLFMQWKRMDWPILVDSLNLLEITVVPLTLAIDEHGIIREVQPPRDELDRLRRQFVDVDFEPPADIEPESIRPSPAEARFLEPGPERLDAAVAAFERQVEADPDDGYTLFRAGVAYRARYDSPQRRPGDFRRAVEHWQAALEVDPNNYIWRRRIQQYGPRLDKPYPFYDWVATARREIEARGGTPAPLVVEPGGAELAAPAEELVMEEPREPPVVDERILRDEGRFVRAEATMVPSVVTPGEVARAHVTFVPRDEIEAHWNNEVDDLVFWVEPPDGWQVDRRVQSVPNPPQTVSREPRRVELEVRVPAGAEPGRVDIPGYALYYVCEDVNGMCLYRRRDVTLSLDVRDGGRSP